MPQISPSRAPSPARSDPFAGKAAALSLLALCEVGALAVWFSGAAVAPSLAEAFALSPVDAGRLTSFVQLGFVLGALASAMSGLADRVDPRALMSGGALLAAAANAALLIAPPDSAAALLSRLVVGACMALVYPVGMKLAAGWARPGRGGDLGLVVGLLVGALTLGSAAPHLAHLLGGVDWRATVIATSALTGLSGLFVVFVRLGPALRGGPARRFRVGDALTLWRDPALRLANLGYLGHMWELYAVWAWIAVFLEASFQASGAAPFGLEGPSDAARITAFAAMGIAGAVGCAAAGVLADRIGRTRLTAGAMAISGACALLAGAVFGGPPALMALLALIWGLTIAADSAQFSAAAAELAPPDRVGTVLTAQTCGGFLLTILTIQGAPLLAEAIGWRWAFAPLALGPALGVIAMLRLRARPEAARLAGGRR